MTDTRFNLIFEGKVEPGHDPEEVRLVLESLFQFDSEDHAQLFGGNAIILGESMDVATANAFQQAMAGAGATTHLEAANDATDAVQENRRAAQRRTNSTRRARARPSAILPDRRVGGDRRRKKRS